MCLLGSQLFVVFIFFVIFAICNLYILRLVTFSSICGQIFVALFLEMSVQKFCSGDSFPSGSMTCF